MGEFKPSYKLDGSEAPSPLHFNGMTIDRTTKLVWEGNRLTLITTSKIEGQSLGLKSATVARRRWRACDESTGPDFQGGGAPITAKATYKQD